MLQGLNETLFQDAFDQHLGERHDLTENFGNHQVITWWYSPEFYGGGAVVASEVSKRVQLCNLPVVLSASQFSPPSYLQVHVRMARLCTFAAVFKEVYCGLLVYCFC